VSTDSGHRDMPRRGDTLRGGDIPGRGDIAGRRPQRWRRSGIGAAVMSAALAVSGCGLALKLPTPPHAASGPSAGTGTAGVDSAPAVTHHEIPTPPGPQERTAAGAATAPEALHSFATRYINWTAAGVEHQLRQLAAASVGQARTAMALAARQTGADPELAQAGVANHGTVEAVAQLGGGDGRWVVVTRESTTARNSSIYAGLAPAWHLTVATVVRREGGWVVSGWQPEN
jgi:hypothetical protein